MDDYTYGKTYLDPEHVKDGGVTHEHVRERALSGGLGLAELNSVAAVVLHVLC